MKQICLIYVCCFYPALLFAQQICLDVPIGCPMASDINQGAFMQDLRWPIGSTVRIKFIDRNAVFEEKVKVYAAEWLEYVNLKFEYVESDQADIRIGFRDGKGSFSLIGTQALTMSQDGVSGMAYVCNSGITMNFGWFDEYSTTDYEYKRIILHEFGHALGLLHEHLNPLAGIEWNKEKLYAYYLQTQNWTPDMVDNNILIRYDVSHTNHQYDAHSIMHYPVQKEFTNNGYEVPWNYELSTSDKLLVAQLYPKENLSINSDAYRITGIFYDASLWGVAMTRTYNGQAQEYFLDNNFPQSKIDSLMTKGYAVTELKYAHNKWAVVMTHGCGYMDQYYRMNYTMPSEEITAAAAKGYTLSHIDYGNELWVSVLTKHQLPRHQIWDYTQLIDPSNVAAQKAKGYRITHLSFKDKSWNIIYTTNTGILDQFLYESTEFPQAKIQAYWQEGYTIEELLFMDDKWVLLMNKEEKYRQQCWRVAPFFPAQEIAKLWNE